MATSRDLQTLDQIWSQLTLQAGFRPTAALSDMIQSEGSTISAEAINAAMAGQMLTTGGLTVTNSSDATTVTLGMDFGFGYLTVDSGGVDEGQGGLAVGFATIFDNGFNAGTGDSSGVGSGSFSWASGQAIQEGANGSLGSGFLYTTSSWQVGYTGEGVPFRSIYLEAGTGNVTATGRVTGASLGVGNAVAATVPGAVVKKVQIFDASGTSLGFIAVYSSIT